MNFLSRQQSAVNLVLLSFPATSCASYILQIMKQLPPEVGVQLIAEVVDDQDALYPSNVSTPTLFALLTVSRMISNIARSLLTANCILYIGPSGRELGASIEHLQTLDITHRPRTQNLFLAPFTPTTPVRRPILEKVSRLLSTIGPSLRKVVVDLSSDGVHKRAEDITVLRQTIRHLYNIEELVMVQNSLCLKPDGWPRPDTPVWSEWSESRRLTLCHLYLHVPSESERLVDGSLQ